MVTSVWQTPEPGRARTPSLSRKRIARAAVRIADREGLAAATLRRVATDVGASTPMSLYRYIGSKDGLADLMLDAVYAEIETPEEPSGDWRADLELLAERTWRAVRRHPWFAELVHTRPQFGPNSLRRLEFGLAAFDVVELGPAAAMTYLSMLDGHVIGSALQVAEESKMRRRTGLATADDLRTAARPLHEAIIAEGRYPRFAAWLEAGARFGLGGGSGGHGGASRGGRPRGGGRSRRTGENASQEYDEGFRLGLEVILDGIAARLPDPNPNPPRPPTRSKGRATGRRGGGDRA